MDDDGYPDYLRKKLDTRSWIEILEEHAIRAKELRRERFSEHGLITPTPSSGTSHLQNDEHPAFLRRRSADIHEFTKKQDQ